MSNNIDNEIDRKGGNNKKQGQLPLLQFYTLWCNFMDKYMYGKEAVKEKKMCCTKEVRDANFKRGANLTAICPEICINPFKLDYLQMLALCD